MAAIPKGGRVRAARDTGASPLWHLRCAEPCGPRGRCASRGEHPGHGPAPAGAHGVCWLASGASEAAVKWAAECRGWTLV